VLATFVADGRAIFAAGVGAGNFAAFRTKRLTGEITFDFAAQFGSLVKSATGTGLVRRVTLVIGVFGVAVSAVAAIQGDGDGAVAMIVARVLVVTSFAVVMTAVIAMIMVAVAVIVTFVASLRSIRGRAAVGSSTTPANYADDRNRCE